MKKLISAFFLSLCFCVASWGGTPTIAAGPAIGTGATVAIEGTDHRGLVTFTVGSGPSAPANAVTITFGTPFTTKAYCVMSSASDTSATTGGMSIVTASATTFSIRSLYNLAGLTGTFQYSFHCQ